MHAQVQKFNLRKANCSPSSQALVSLYNCIPFPHGVLPLNLPFSGLCCTSFHGESLKRVFLSRGADESMMTEGRMAGKERGKTSTCRSSKESGGR